MRLKILLLSLGAISSIIWINFAYAISPSSVGININPKNPAPNEEVSLTLSSYAANLDTVLIVWSIDNENTSSGIGKKTFSMTAGPAGSTTRVIATIYLPDGEIQKIITIRPSVLVLLWQADDSYIPPFYRGKALPTNESDIKIIPMPELNTSMGATSSKNLVYTWQKDYDNDQGASGYAKNYYTYKQDYLENSSTISVTVSTVDQNYSSGASITVPIVNPQISFYKRDEKMGTMWENAILDGHTITGNEIFEAAPYYISPAEIRYPELVFSWFINGDKVAEDPIYKNLLPLAAQEGTTGSATIKLNIESTDKIYQTAEKVMQIQF